MITCYCKCVVFVWSVGYGKELSNHSDLIPKCMWCSKTSTAPIFMCLFFLPITVITTCTLMKW